MVSVRTRVHTIVVSYMQAPMKDHNCISFTDVKWKGKDCNMNKIVDSSWLGPGKFNVLTFQ